MIQDIYPHKLDNQFRAEAVIGENDYVVSFFGRAILVKKSENIQFPTYRELRGEIGDCVYLFSLDEDRFFLTGEIKDIPKEYEYIEFNQIRERKMGPDYMAYVSYTACHLNSWYNDTKYCGRCGSKMSHHATERAMKCECGYTDYPRIMPAVIVGVRNEDKILVTKYREGYKHYALVAGFTEIGETVEETVTREVMEEVGLKVKNIRYYKSQPWGTAKDILLGFFCDVDGDDDISMDSNELKIAKWVSREEIELQPDNYSLTNEMMSVFKNG